MAKYNRRLYESSNDEVEDLIIESGIREYVGTIWAYDELVSLIVNELNNRDIFMAEHIIKGLTIDADYYSYDRDYGVLDEVVPIETPQDLKDIYVDFFEDYYDE